MQNNSYKRILYFIGAVIFITLCIQVYWNYKNFQAGKRQLLNEMQISLDNAVEQYYATGAQKKTRITLADPGQEARGIKVTSMDTTHVLGRNRNFVFVKTDTFRFGENTRFVPSNLNGNIKTGDIDKIEVIRSTRKQDLDSLVGRILVSMKQDTLNIIKMDSLVKTELQRKNIGVEYGLVFSNTGQDEQRVNALVLEEAALQTRSKSAWLPPNSTLTLFFNNETATILKSNMIGLILSTLLMAAVVGCLLFLLRIIRDQKQLAEVKNDLISNITHEFKTPISTIKVAMEGILNFNVENDPEKAKNYARTSTEQVEKLNNMVEKLLETATLTGNQLQMEKEEISLATILKALVQKYAALAPQSTLNFRASREEIIIHADPFHLENAFSNILDNAVKYGGEKIDVNLSDGPGKVIITFSDNGNALTHTQANQVFDKFYRVPKGNTHDVKGFGIGLYYTKQIVERHCGSIKVDVNKTTRFIIELPYE